jgi:hypothetical protein
MRAGGINSDLANRRCILFADAAQFIRDGNNILRNTRVHAQDTAHTTAESKF